MSNQDKAENNNGEAITIECISNTHVEYQNYNAGELQLNKNELTTEQTIESLKQEGKNVENSIDKAFNSQKMAAKNQARKDKQLVADMANLTSTQVTNILSILSKNNTVGSYLISLTLFTGQDMTTNFNNIDVDITRELQFNFKIVNRESKEPLPDGYCHEVTNELTLPLPPAFKAFNHRAEEENVDELINQINDQNCYRIKLSQIANYMTYWMTNKGFDSSEIAILSNKSDFNLSGLSYHQTTSSNLQNQFERYLQHLADIRGRNYMKRDTIQSTLIGSGLVVHDHIVAVKLSELRTKIETNKVIDTLDLIQSHHNWVTIYTLIVMNLATGHRPVNDPYQTLSCVHLQSKTVFINDKRVKNKEMHRVIPLAQVAVAQFQAYLENIRCLQNRLQLLDTNLNDKLQQILESKLPIFQLFVGGQLCPISNTVLTAELATFLPVPLNWNRHFMRAKLRQYNVCGQDVDMWMGHEGKGDYAMGESSSCSMKALVEVARNIDLIFKDLNITAVSGVKS